MTGLKEICQAFDENKGNHNIQFSLKHEQSLLVQAVLQGRNAVGLLLTGYGKTLCYTAPRIIRKAGTVLVVSPLNALMQDHMATLQG